MDGWTGLALLLKACLDFQLGQYTTHTIKCFELFAVQDQLGLAKDYNYLKTISQEVKMLAHWKMPLITVNAETTKLS